MYIGPVKQPVRTICMPKEYAYYMKFSYDEKKLLMLCYVENGLSGQTKIYMHTINEQGKPFEYLDESEIDSVAFCTDNIRFAFCIGAYKGIYIRNLSDYSLIQKIKCDLFHQIDTQWIMTQRRCGNARYFITLQLDTWTDQKDLFRNVWIKQKLSGHFQIDIFDRISLMVRSNYSQLTILNLIRQNKKFKRIYCKNDLTKFLKHNTQLLYFVIDSRNNCQIRNRNGKLVRFYRAVLKGILNLFNESHLEIIQVFDYYLYIRFGSRIGKINITSGTFKLIDLFGNLTGLHSGCIAVSREYQAVTDEKILNIYEQ